MACGSANAYSGSFNSDCVNRVPLLPAPTPNGRPHIKKLLEYCADPNVDVWAIDEVHFEQHGSRCRMWVAPEDKDPILLHHPTRKKVGYFGAVRIRDGVLVMSREENRFNAETTWRFLKRLRKKSKRTGRKTVVIIDNARYHHAKLHKEWRALQEPDFVLAFLPPYSPKLNPIERVWKLTRRLCIHNRYFPTLDAVIQRVEAQFTLWAKANTALTSLCAII